MTPELQNTLAGQVNTPDVDPELKEAAITAVQNNTTEPLTTYCN